MSSLVWKVWARGHLVQAKCVSTLIDLGRRNTRKGRYFAAQALAKIVISVNPSLIPEPQMMDAVGPLVYLLASDDGLQQVRRRRLVPV